VSVAVWYVPRFVAAGGKPWFYQQEFGAAAMQACGLGYVNPDATAQPALTAFLERQSDSISCDTLRSVQTRPLTSMQRAFRYLMMAVANTWSISGEVAWSGLLPLYGLLYGVTAVLGFTLFRQATGRVLAALLTTTLILSTLHLNNLPHLRDYAKAPFVLAMALVALRLVLGHVTPKRTLLLAIGGGLTTGVGIGFRNDLLVAIPAFVGTLALFVPGDIRATWRVRVTSIAVYLLATYVAMWPMLSIYRTGGGGSTPHLILLGLTPEFSERLGVDNSDLYELGFEYRDELALAMIDNYSDRRLGEHRFLEMYGADYDRAAGRLLLDYAKDFPADLLARVYASAIRITQLPHLETTSAVVVPAFLPSAWQRGLLIKTEALRMLGGLWPWPLVFALLLLCLTTLRVGLFALLSVAYLSGYPALQFQERHFFHLEFVAWMLLGFAIAVIASGARAVIQPQRRQVLTAGLPGSRPALIAVGSLVVLVVLTATPLWALRRQQSTTVTELLAGVARAQRADLPIAPVAAGDTTAFLLPELSRRLPPDGGVHAHYLAAEFGGTECNAMRVTVTQRYRATQPGYDFTHQTAVEIPVSDATTQLVFPAYYRNPLSVMPADEPMAFAGLELPSDSANCLRRIAVLETPSHPALLDLRLPPDWQRVTPYATISGVEWRQNPARAYTVPDDLPRAHVKAVLAGTPTAFSESDILKVSPTFAMNGAQWDVDGVGGVGGRGPLLYLVEMKPRRIEQGTAFIAEGTIEKGGVTFGFVADDEWKVQLHVVQTGDFSVVLIAPETRDYKVVFANNLRGMSLMNKVRVRRAGLVEAVTP